MPRASGVEVGLSGFVASVEFRHHRPCGAVGVGQHDGIDVSVAVPGEQGADAGVAAFLVEGCVAELRAEAVTDLVVPCDLGGQVCLRELGRQELPGTDRVEEVEEIAG